MNSTEQLKTLLANALKEGFSPDDISSLTKEIEQENKAKDEENEWLDTLQREAAEALTDFLYEIDYFKDEDADYDDQYKAVYTALQLVRDGKLNVEVKDFGKGCSCSSSYTSSVDELDVDTFRKMLSKFF